MVEKFWAAAMTAPDDLLMWWFECCDRFMISNSKRYIVLFCALVLGGSWLVKATIETAGFQIPDWALMAYGLGLVALGIGWLNIFREIPHSQDRSSQK
jgi:hypothetical protein